MDRRQGGRSTCRQARRHRLLCGKREVTWFCTHGTLDGMTLRTQQDHIFDALSGKRLHVLEQCVAIDVTGSSELTGVKDAEGLTRWLLSLHARYRRSEGTASGLRWRNVGSIGKGDELTNKELSEALQSNARWNARKDVKFTEAEWKAFGVKNLRMNHFIKSGDSYFQPAAVDTPACALLTAGPAAGKTCLLSQIIIHTLNDSSSGMVPILVKVQLLQNQLLSDVNAFASSWNWIDAYLKIVHDARPDVYRFLRQAMMARRALLLLDGLDEGGLARERIERHVTEVLAPQGHVLLATSRPAGIDDKRFSGFTRLSLSPLSDPQQQQAVEQRLDQKQAKDLMLYVRGVMPVDKETGQRITGNPLMLSMVVSIFEIGAAVMPKTMVDLYDSDKRCLSAPAPRMTRHADAQGSLLRGAHRCVPHYHDQAPRGRCKATRGRKRERTRTDHGARAAGPHAAMALLQAEPVQIQAAHLSFQEYYVARAICEQSWEPPQKPWEFSAHWDNVVKMGGEMGEDFCRSLLRATRCEDLDVSNGGLGSNGDRATALKAVMHLITGGLRSLNLEHNQLGSSLGASGLSIALKTNSALRRSFSRAMASARKARSTSQQASQRTRL